jgi:hypothetical protein
MSACCHVPGTALRKPARSSRSRHRFRLGHPPGPATRPPAVPASPASAPADRAMTCQAANRPQPGPEPVIAVPLPVLSLPGHPASRTPRPPTRPAAQPAYLRTAAMRGNARSCRGQSTGLDGARSGQRVHDVSAETPCARFHKPAPRKRPVLMPSCGCGPACREHVRADLAVPRSSCWRPRGSRAAFHWPHRGRDGQYRSSAPVGVTHNLMASGNVPPRIRPFLKRGRPVRLGPTVRAASGRVHL